MLTPFLFFPYFFMRGAAFFFLSILHTFTILCIYLMRAQKMQQRIHFIIIIILTLFM